MADLSKMLGDVYGEPTTKPATAPEWSDEGRLDEAFDGWTPGPSPDASAAERRFFGARTDEDAKPLADDLASALSEAVLAKADVEDEVDEFADVDEPRVHDADEDSEEPHAPAPYQPRKSAFDFSAASNDEDIYRAMAVLRHDPEPPVAPIEVPAPPPVVEPVVELQPMAELQPIAVAGPWQRDHDDILPRRAKARGVQLSFRRR